MTEPPVERGFAVVGLGYVGLPVAIASTTLAIFVAPDGNRGTARS